jgi:hypothetical protein
MPRTVSIMSTPIFLRRRPTKHLDRVGIAVEILIVEMLDQFGARDTSPM